MEKMGLNEIREKYLSFFEGKDHLRMASASLVPVNDDSLLLINSGMAPLKAFFTGAQTPPRKRVTTCQKCIRTPDIERVGKTARHGTFFEMLGNFSFGDYFKKEATAWAWEFVTEVMKLPVDRLWVSIYEEDDEAAEIWVKHVGVDASRIVRLGKEDNFWEHGTGPCGPCSEIYYDLGPEFGCGEEGCAVGCDCDRYVEFWNLVFTQFDKDTEGNYNRLANPNIDTGMGLERLAAIMQGVGSLFEVDTVRNIMQHISRLAGVEYKTERSTDISLRVITDHIRSTVFMVSDGIMPSNEGRGYVLRRLLRRAARHGKLLGIAGQFLHEVAETVIEESGEAYPELREKRDYIRKIIRVEEERFQETIDQGLAILAQYMGELRNAKILPGDKVFKLYDTFGFPLDLTTEILSEKGLEADIEGFEKNMTEQRERARAARAEGSSWDDDEANSEFDGLPATEFVGYDELRAEAKVLAVRQRGELTEIVLDKTPFYSEKGGQVGDSGVIRTEGGVLSVENTVPWHEVSVHYGTMTGNIAVGESATAEVDDARRKAIKRNHSATHLMQKALQNILGSHVAQSGSLVTPDRLRFDFTHFSPMTPGEIQRVEDEVNSKILEDLNIEVREMPIAEARAAGAMALFGEKYGEVVRVVRMGDYSVELCGGCHLENTAKAGLFKIVSETGIASGVRRIEAVTGLGALEYLRKVQLDGANSLEKMRNEMKDSIREARRVIESLTAKQVGGVVEGLIAKAQEVGDVKLITARLDELDAAGIRNACDELKTRLPGVVAVLSSVRDGKVNFVAMASSGAVELGAHAGRIVSEVAKIAGGGGGGKPDMAQAGGRDPSKVQEALEHVKKILREMI